MDPVDTFHFPDGTRFARARRTSTSTARLKAEFPRKRRRTRRFFAAVREAYLWACCIYFRGRAAAQTSTSPTAT